jgi:acyl-CoA reductase-like NAD-dependent aldehyde dehydrogenase
MAFDTADEAVALANDTTFGLSGAVIAGTVEEALPVAERINAGGLSVNDCALTILTYEPEKNSFGLSGMGGSRMGPASINRFLRRKALIMQSGVPAPLDVLEESRAPSRA